MDCRVTLGKDETFVDMLRSCMQTKQRASILLDEDGLDRTEGWIKSMELDGPEPFIELDNGMRIRCRAIVALNGVFLDMYSGC